MKKAMLLFICCMISFSLWSECSDLSCANCNPCVVSCVIAGCFQVGSFPGGSANAPVISQKGTNFVVTPSATLGQYTVTLLSSFCKKVAVVGLGSAVNGAGTDPDNGTTVINVPTMSLGPTSTFTLGNILSDNQIVCFLAIPYEQ